MQRLYNAILAAVLTFIIAAPIMGMRLGANGTILSVTTANTRQWIYIAIGVGVVFLSQLFAKEWRALLKPIGMFLARGKQAIPSHLLPISQVRNWRHLPKVSLVLVITGAVILPFLLSRTYIDIATLVLIYIMLGLGLNIVVGLAGLLDLGYVAFYAVGAYTYALLSQGFGISFWLCLPIAALLAALFGFILGFPVLRLRGDYLAIVTLGFGEIIRILLNNWSSVTGGPSGIAGIPKPTLFGLEFSRRAKEGSQTFAQFFGIDYSGTQRMIFMYLVALLLVLLILFVINRLVRMPIGRAWEALREDEIACRSLGLNRTVIKLSAFTIGASTAGFAGAFFAARQGFISPESFVFLESVIILTIVVLGGMGSQLGVILAAIIMTLLPELTREFADYRMLMFGLLMVLMMRWRPQGLLPAKRVHLELKS